MAIEKVDYSLLKPNPFQPKSRWPIDPGSVRELADDLKANGLIHKPVGRHTENGTVEIAVGHRRISAWVIAFPGEPIPMDIMDLSDRQMYDHLIAEGQHRLDWTALEKGERLADYMSRFNVSQTEAARRFNMTQGAASNLIRLARDLPTAVKPLVTSRQLPERFARQIVTLARIDDKASVKVAQAIAQADESERERIAQAEVAEFLEHKAESLSDIAWPVDWKPERNAMIERQLETPPACQGCPAVESAMQIDYCTRPACFKAKGLLWQARELIRLSEKFAIQIATKGEMVHILQVNWQNEAAAKALLADKKAERDHLRLMSVELNKHNREGVYYLKGLLGSNQALLGSTLKTFEIKREEPWKASGASKAPPANETAAQKAAREKREERERQARREEKAALRRAKADVCWLLTHVAEIIAPSMQISGGVLVYCLDLRMHHSISYIRNDWPEYTQAAKTLHDQIDKVPDSDKRETLIKRAIILEQLHLDIADYNKGYRVNNEFDVERDIAIISETIGKTFRLGLPQGWHAIPVHKTDSNCHVCGKFTSLDHITGVDQAAGWRSENGQVTCSDECRAIGATRKRILKRVTADQTRAAKKSAKPDRRGRK